MNIHRCLSGEGGKSNKSEYAQIQPVLVLKHRSIEEHRVHEHT